MGKLLVFEGIDGSGKSTQFAKAAEWLRGLGKSVYATEEPSKKFFRDIIKDAIRPGHASPQLTALLFATDRLHHIETEIAPELARHDFVLTDRYWHSSLTYQALETGDLRWVMEINKFVRRPDLTIVIDTAPEAALERIAAAGRPVAERARFERLEFLARLRERYLKLGEVLPEERIAFIDGNRGVDEVFADVKAAIQQKLM